MGLCQLTYPDWWRFRCQGWYCQKSMAPGATTHDVDMNARHVELAVTPSGGGAFTATAPTASVAPPGYYMLFALTSTGVPSVAGWLHVGPLT